jgi:hypothetical protein
VLEPGGRIALADGTADSWAARLADRLLRRFDRSHVRLYRSDELISMLTDADFGGTELRWVYDRGYVIITARRG